MNRKDLNVGDEVLVQFPGIVGRPRRCEVVSLAKQPLWPTAVTVMTPWGKEQRISARCILAKAIR